MVRSLLILASLLAAADALTVLRARQASLDKDVAQQMGKDKLLVHYINLDSSTARKEHTENLLNQMGIEYERYSAVTRDDARNLDLKEFSDEGTFQEYMEKQYNEDAQWGTVAVWTSHMRLLKDISQDKDSKRVHIILEDDFAMNNMAPQDLIPSVMDDIAQLPEDWDVFKFGYFADGGCEEGKAITDNICRWTHWDMKVMGNLGYAVTAKGAKTMLEHIRSHQIADLDGAMMPDCEGAECASVQPNFYATTSSHLTSTMGSLGGSVRNPEHFWDLKEIPADYGSKQRLVKLKEASNPLDWFKKEPTKKEPTVQVYVLNLASRTDKCECMNKQLAESPYPVHRIIAANKHEGNMPQECSQIANIHGQGDGRAHLFCSNYLAWTHVDAPKSDYIMILEDDANLKHDQGFWEKVQTMLKCESNDWDELVVDSFGTTGTNADVCDHSSDMTTPHSWGTHMTLIRTSALPKMIESAHKNGWGIMDNWDAPFYSNMDTKRKKWLPGIVSQSSAGQEEVPARCPEIRARDSDIAFRELEKSKKKTVLEC